LFTTGAKHQESGRGVIWNAGLPNLGRHLDKPQGVFGVPTIRSGSNRFSPNDTDADLKRLGSLLAQNMPRRRRFSEAFYKRRARERKNSLRKFAGLIDKNPSPNVRPVYKFDEPIVEKKDYRRVAAGTFTERVRSATAEQAQSQAAAILGSGVTAKLADLHCENASTPSQTIQKSFGRANRMDAARKRTPSLSGGAGFIVVISGNIMADAGPSRKYSRAASIDLDDSGEIIGARFDGLRAPCGKIRAGAPRRKSTGRSCLCYTSGRAECACGAAFCRKEEKRQGCENNKEREIQPLVPQT